MMSRTRWLITMAAVMLWGGLSGLAVAGNYGSIVSFDDSEVEVRKGDDFDYLPVTDFPNLPIKVIDKDSKNFLKVRTRTGDEVWVSPSYVTTDSLRNMKKNCQTRKVARQGDKRQYGVRGVGEQCE